MIHNSHTEVQMENKIKIMDNQSKLEFAAKLHKEVNSPSVDEEDIYKLLNNQAYKSEEQVRSAMNAMAYIRMRDFEGMTRVDAYKTVFPARWEQTDTTKMIGARARRFETTENYRKMVVELQMNFYGIFAVERVHATSEALRRAYDPDTSEKYQFENLKLFLDTTMKPAEARGNEINVNIGNGAGSIADVEAQLNAIANKLDGKSQGEIIDAVMVTDDTA